MKIANHICLFNQDKWIIPYIKSVKGSFEKIYISYSNKPWNYNLDARLKYKNKFKLEKIKDFIDDSFVLIEGEWDNETQQRNACVEAAKKDKMDYLMIQDVDEFYTQDDYFLMKKHLKNNPDFDFYTCGWISFWKSFDYYVIGDKNNKIIGYPQILLNLNKNIFFKDKRFIDSEKSSVIKNITCYHGSFVLNDQECLEKIETWGHTKDFDYLKWYKNVWKLWDEKATCLHPINPCAWKSAVKDLNALPQQIRNYFL